MSLADTLRGEKRPDETTTDLHVLPAHLVSQDDSGSIPLVNASGHEQELEKNFNFLSLAAIGVVNGASWPFFGGSIIDAIYNGGPPGVIYEFLTVSVFYCCVMACLAELASSIPSSAGVYHWASVGGGPRYGKICGWFAGWWNLSAWIMGTASGISLLGNIIVAMWGLFHHDYHFQRWHVFLSYVIVTWICTLVVAYANRSLPYVGHVGLFFMIAGVIITTIVCAVMPGTSGSGYANPSFVWTDWQNQTGYSSNGFVFVAGLVNGAFSIGALDSITHLSEEIPRPKVNVPRALIFQLSVSILSSIPYMIALFYAISSLDNVLATEVHFPLAAIYRQATNSAGGALGLLLLAFIPIFTSMICISLTNSRIMWTLARDGAVPFSRRLAIVDDKSKTPVNAALTNGVLVTLMGCLYIASNEAFNAFVGSFVVLTTLSYVAAILPNMLTKGKYVQPGPFHMRGTLATIVRATAATYIVVSNVIYCFPASLPVSADSMNYTCVITAGFTTFMALWWFWKSSRGYEGPKALMAEAFECYEHGVLQTTLQEREL